MDKQAKTFNSAVTSQLKHDTKKRQEALAEAVRILSRSEAEIKKILSSAPGDWQAYHYAQLLPKI